MEEINLLNGMETIEYKLKKINKNLSCSKSIINELKGTLHENEEIIFFTGGTSQSKYYYIFITNKRIICINKAIFSEQQIQIPIEKITSIGQSNGLILGKIQIWDGSSSSVTIENVLKKDTTAFVRAVNNQIDKYKSFKIEINKTEERDITDKIEKLAELHKDGILTDYEFGVKKLELLDKLKK